MIAVFLNYCIPVFTNHFKDFYGKMGYKLIKLPFSRKEENTNAGNEKVVPSMCQKTQKFL